MARLPTMLRAIMGADLNISVAAKKLGIGRPALSNVLNGNAELSLELAAKIEDVFNYSGLALLQEQTQQKWHEYRKTTGSTILPVFKNGEIA